MSEIRPGDYVRCGGNGEISRVTFVWDYCGLAFIRDRIGLSYHNVSTLRRVARLRVRSVRYKDVEGDTRTHLRVLLPPWSTIYWPGQ
jgi:hypothetical protein